MSWYKTAKIDNTEIEGDIMETTYPESPPMESPKPSEKKWARDTYEIDGITYMAPIQNPNAPIYEVDVKLLDKKWKKDVQDFYLSPGHKDDRRLDLTTLMNNETPIEVPEIEIDENGNVHFENGRHRFAVIRDMGKQKTAMNIKFAHPDALSFIGAKRIS